jgi:hypothetical protein
MIYRIWIVLSEPHWSLLHHISSPSLQVSQSFMSSAHPVSPTSSCAPFANPLLVASLYDYLCRPSSYRLVLHHHTGPTGASLDHAVPRPIGHADALVPVDPILEPTRIADRSAVVLHILLPLMLFSSSAALSHPCIPHSYCSSSLAIGVTHLFCRCVFLLRTSARTAPSGYRSEDIATALTWPWKNNQIEFIKSSLLPISSPSPETNSPSSSPFLSHSAHLLALSAARPTALL